MHTRAGTGNEKAPVLLGVSRGLATVRVSDLPLVPILMVEVRGVEPLSEMASTKRLRV